MTKEKEIVNCLHRNIEALTFQVVRCHDCGKQLKKEEWVKLNKEVLEKEHKWLLRDDTCKHGRIVNSNGKASCIDCGMEFEIEEWLLYREPYNLLRDAYSEYSKAELANIIISLREKLEQAHKDLEIDHHFIFRDQKKAKESGISQDGDALSWLVRENVPLEKRDTEINAVFCRDTKVSVLKDDNKQLNLLLSQAIDELKTLGIDTSKYEEYDD